MPPRGRFCTQLLRRRATIPPNPRSGQDNNLAFQPGHGEGCGAVQLRPHPDCGAAPGRFSCRAGSRQSCLEVLPCSLSVPCAPLCQRHPCSQRDTPGCGTAAVPSRSPALAVPGSGWDVSPSGGRDVSPPGSGSSRAREQHPGWHRAAPGLPRGKAGRKEGRREAGIRQRSAGTSRGMGLGRRSRQRVAQAGPCPSPGGARCDGSW